MTRVLEGGRVPYRVLVGKPERKRELGTPRSRWRDYVKTDLKEIGLEGRGLFSLRLRTSGELL